MLSDAARGWTRVLALGLAAALGGCASMLDMAGVPRAGHQSDGTYVVSADEEGLACRQIRERLDILSHDIKTLPQEAAREQESQPSTVGAIFGRMFGAPGAGNKALEEYRKAKAESDALYALYVRKQCV